MTSDQLILEIGKVHNALKNLDAGGLVENAEEAKTSLSVKDAFKKSEVVCMVCGKGGFKTLARHLNTAHGMKPGQYKKQFGIPSNTPLSARNYSESRRKMALDRGLADNLAKAREVRMANIVAKKGSSVTAKAAKAAKAAAPKVAKAVKAAKPAKAPAAKAAKAPKAKAVA
jgi:predicted transcriptional regulator